MLIRKDKEFAHDASIIQTLVSQGYITGELKDSFPAANIVDPDNFISLLYYFGMLTISEMHKGKQTHHSQSGSGRATIHLFAEYIQ